MITYPWRWPEKISLERCSLHSLRWRHNGRDSVSNHQTHDCLLNSFLRRRSKKTSKLRVTGLCVGNSPGPVNSPHKAPVTRKMFRFDDVIMCRTCEHLAKLVRHTCGTHSSGQHVDHSVMRREMLMKYYSYCILSGHNLSLYNIWHSNFI